MSREAGAGARCTLSLRLLLRIRNFRGSKVSGMNTLETEVTISAKMAVQEEGEQEKA